MKSKNLLIAGALALSTVMTPVASMLSAMPINAETVSVSEEFQGDHTFKAYRIFKGVQGTNGILTNIEWDTDDVDDKGILADIESSNLAALKGATTAAQLAKKLDQIGDNTATAKAFAKIVEDNIKTSGGEEISSDTTTLDAGYYLIVDTSSQTKEVVGLSILQLTGTTDGIQITPKNAKPRVDKEVKDEGDTGDGWGETADHDLNKSIDFRIKTLDLTKSGIENYETYYLEFSDVLSEGLDFESITSMKMGDTELSDADKAKFTTDAPTEANNNTLRVYINDLKSLSAYENADDINITIEYKAKLNNKAVVNPGNGNILNNNEVELIYSNNPNTDGKGHSDKDKVFVASFKLTNKKVAGSEDGAALAGAGFELHKGNQVAIFKQQTIKVLNGSGTAEEETGYVFQKWVDTDYELDEDNGEVKEIFSDANGDFSMYGLDAGTYTLVETTTPANYNTAADTTVTIKADHNETAEKTSATVELTDNSTAMTTVINTQTGKLPETGGMGTTLMYGVGTLMVAGAAVVFVTNKRTKKN